MKGKRVLDVQIKNKFKNKQTKKKQKKKNRQERWKWQRIWELLSLQLKKR